MIQANLVLDFTLKIIQFRLRCLLWLFLCKLCWFAICLLILFDRQKQ